MIRLEPKIYHLQSKPGAFDLRPKKNARCKNTLRKHETKKKKHRKSSKNKARYTNASIFTLQMSHVRVVIFVVDRMIDHANPRHKVTKVLYDE